ncbi:MAG: EAL domain-containing protein, partial [Myxococcales bacterium]|nr:EAL domain-containing protein [Myxococcales bacterium]
MSEGRTSSFRRSVTRSGSRVGHESGFVAIPGNSTLDAPPRLIDLTTGLPALTALFNELRPLPEKGGASIVYVHLPSNELIEERYGWEALEAYTGFVASDLSRYARELRADRDFCVLMRAFADDFVMIFPAGDSDAELSARIVSGVRGHLQAVDEELAELHEIYIGTASIRPFAKIHPERWIYRGIQKAQREATDVGRQRLGGQVRVLDSCIRERAFRMVYQPLVDVRDRSIFAYEALCRCTMEQLRNPHMLFNVAEQGDRIWPLSRVLRRMTCEAIPSLPEGRLMFINVHPRDFDDPQLLQPEPWLVEHADRIVLEVTERATITDFDDFRRNMEVLREHGVRIAVDDLGSGYAALSSVAELQPDFIKFDMTLIRDIHESPVRQNLLRNMISFARDMNAGVIGEGVEIVEELDTLVDLQCTYVQGYYFAKPTAQFLQAVSV